MRWGLEGKMEPLTVLVVDDNPTFLRLAVRFLQEQNASQVAVVGVATSGTEALAKASELKPAIILLDLMMPDLSGLDTVMQMRRMLPEAGILMLTVLDSEAYRKAALGAGADDFVSKATLIADLLPAIERVAANKGLRKGAPAVATETATSV
jgi:two-component system OmpR family response regulator